MIEEISENSQQDSDILSISDFNFSVYKSKDSKIQKPMPVQVPLETISKMFTIDTEKKQPDSLSIDDELENILYENKSNKSPSILVSEEKNKSSIFEPEESNDNDIEPMQNLEMENEKSEKKIPSPSNEKNDRINAVSNSFDYIFKILSIIKYPEDKIKEIKKDIITQKDIENIWLFEVKKKDKNKKKHKSKDKSKTTKKEKEKEEIIKKEVKQGRKSLNNDDGFQGNHGKDCPDNIIKKIKAFLFSSVIEYVQKFINENKKKLDKDIKLLTLDYKNVNKLEKKFNIELLKTPLGDLVSREISSRYRNHEDDKDWNKKIIKNVLEKEKGNDKIVSLLNMSFDKWIDIFTYKIKWEYNIETEGIKSFLKKIQEDTDAQYFSKVIFYLFNYQKWFLHKKGRQPKKQK